MGHLFRSSQLHKLSSEYPSKFHPLDSIFQDEKVLSKLEKKSEDDYIH